MFKKSQAVFLVYILVGYNYYTAWWQELVGCSRRKREGTGGEKIISVDAYLTGVLRKNPYFLK
jgi:hypothetical protein